MAKGILAILGSGETAPNMVKVYRQFLQPLGEVSGVLLDTPFGFQENIPQLTAKIVDYFKISLLTDVTPATFTSFEQSTALERTQFIATIERSNFVFAGPGSPTYAMKQWGPLNLGSALLSVLDRGGVVCFSSAAALTLGRCTAPIYELYKVGEAPHWVAGLDLLSAYGLNCAVIPHFDNAEGGNHDTRFCYLGERRLTLLESMLDNTTATFGVDEHTAAVFDLNKDTVTVLGRGHAYWRTGSEHRQLSKGEAVPLDELRNTVGTTRAQGTKTSVVRSTAQQLAESVLHGGGDSTAALAELVALAASGGPGRIDPTPLVDGILRVRTDARSLGQYQLADELRDALLAAGIDVQDTAGGGQWSLREP